MLIDNPNDVNIPSALSILSLQSVSSPNELKGEVEHSGFKSKRRIFPSAWLSVLLFLLLCHHVSASELFQRSTSRSEQLVTSMTDYRLANLLESDSVRQLINELNMSRLADRELTTTPVSQLQNSGWQLNLDHIELGGVGSTSQDVWATQDYGYRDLLSQDSRLYSGWGARVGYRFRLASGVSALVNVGAFNWEQESGLLHNNKQNLEPDGISPYLGVGFNFKVSPKSDIRLEWDHFELDDRSFEVIGLKFEYRF
ncbi:hypothetical protein EKG38_05260 [Shewanella canadensis]|uniref:Outer membrane protein beta-barrel domain-containing protein n=1 Tax=Shewanella canadensis TaxID=271096 RepID=A0A3S0RZN1_9GAMM|nr:hypothetical protein [Shewanella canadensis]RTR40134.1 hypothetical protein EKG38_05260 [Shewanella canadensis]